MAFGNVISLHYIINCRFHIQHNDVFKINVYPYLKAMFKNVRLISSISQLT